MQNLITGYSQRHPELEAKGKLVKRAIAGFRTWYHTSTEVSIIFL